MKKTLQSPLDESGMQAIYEFSKASLILPEDVVRLFSGLPVKEPFLIDPNQIRGRNEVDRFLNLLSAIYSASPFQFERAVPNVKGTTRRYFGKSYAEVASTGSSNVASQIPKTPWWVSTNNWGPRKVSIVYDLMREMKSSHEYARLVARSI